MVVVGLSGGVDSAVAALLLQRAGHEVVAVFMKNWEEDDTDSHCAAAEDLRAAESVAAHLGIPLRTVNFSADYWEHVFEHFLDELRSGRTPNPDVLCNREIKFRAFLNHALSLGADQLATGHYARVAQNPDRTWRLLRGVDPAKDQSYFLHLVGQEALSRTQFPLGNLQKAEVREIARAAGIPNWSRRDSTGLCFIGERNFPEFLKRFLKTMPGNIRTVEGQQIGEHAGLERYTIGQRQGIGIGGAGDAWYVVAKEVQTNTLIVAQGAEHPALYARALRTGVPHWIPGAPPPMPFRCSAQIRYRQEAEPCDIECPAGGDALHVRFDRPQRAVTPGQSIVFYDGDACLGGAVVS